MPNTQLLSHQQNGVTFADPNDPDYIVRFKTTSNPKNVDGLNLQNYISEIIITDRNNVTIGSETVSDPISVRVRLSGSLESRSRISAILTALAAQVTVWDTENVYVGFEPTTVPIVPV